MEPDNSTELYTYTLRDGNTIDVHTDPLGKWKAGVSATVWDCSLILSKHFEKVFHDDAQAGNEYYELLRRNKLAVMELGAGCSALPSIVLAHLRISDSAEKLTSSMTVSDKAAALALLGKSINDQQVALRSSIQVLELDWTVDETSATLTERGWDLIIASDLLAFPDLYHALASKLILLANESTVIYIAYERRVFESEIQFFKILGAAFTFEIVPEEELDAVWRAPGEIYLYRARKRSHTTQTNRVSDLTD